MSAGTRLVAVAVIAAWAAPAAAQNSPAGEELNLFSATNLKGQKRTIGETMPSLSGADADNFAWSLSTRGRWEVCMDAGHRAGCRIVQGEIMDLGTDGGAITSVRYLGAAGQAAATSAAPASPLPAAAPAPAHVGWVYETDFNDMTITSWSETQVAGRYEYAAGRIEGVPSGRTVTGYWMQEESPLTCGAVRGGTTHWGRFSFTFNADFTAFTGTWGDCNDAPGKPWNGRVIRRGDGQASAAGAGGAAGTPGAADRLAERAVGAAEDEVGRQIEGSIRRVIGSIGN